ncbi:MAG: PEP-CTERM sorting domain-containing protein [Phycisphaeraceae bacterium]
MKTRLARRACAIAAMNAVVLAMSAPASGTVIPLTDFVNRFGAGNLDQFTIAVNPGSSGQNVGYTSGTTNHTATGGSFEGRAHNRLVITDTNAATGTGTGGPPAATTAWSLRHFMPASSQNGDESGITPPQTFPVPTVGNIGFAGYYLRTSTAGLSTALAVDDGAGGTERSTIVSVIADGQWHRYEWNLGDANQWVSQFSGDGDIDSPNSLVDAVWLWRDVAFNSNGVTSQVATVDFDFLGWNPAGSLAAIPGLFNTGLNEVGTPGTAYTGDAHWTVNRVASAGAPASTELGAPGAIVNQDGNPIPPWAGNNATSGWISSQYTVNFDDIAGFYDFNVDFNVNADDVLAQVIEGRWLADDQGIEIFLNGAPSGFTVNSQTTFASFMFDSGFVAGLNRLTFRTENIGTTDSGIRVEFTNVFIEVPEPATLTLGALGMLALGARRNRRQNSISSIA